MSRSFDGIDDNINYGSSSKLTDLGPFTYYAYFNAINDGENNGGRFFDKRASSAAGFSIISCGSNANGISFAIDYTTQDLLVRTSAGAWTANAWNFLAFTWNGGTTASTSVKIYINGKEASYAVQQNAVGTRVSDSGGSVYVGDDGINSNRCFNGKLAYVGIHNVILTLNELSQIRRCPGSISRGMVLFSPLLGSSPETEYSGNNNFGTVTASLTSLDNPPINGIFKSKRSSLHYSATIFSSSTSGPVIPSGYRFRKTLSGIGTRTFSRQVHNWG